jgi:hypothetical protein
VGHTASVHRAATESAQSSRPRDNIRATAQLATNDASSACCARMPERRAFIEQQARAIEVHGIDVVAQVQALLRAVADFQRQAIRLQGSPTESANEATRKAAAAAVQKCVLQLKDHAKTLCDTLDEVEQAAAGMNRIFRSGKSA